MTIRDFMSKDHKFCDEGFAEFENAVVKGDKDVINGAFDKMQKEFEEHFEMEEKVLFLEFESKSGMSCGPTEVMRREHEQIRFNIKMIKKALDTNSKNQILGACESLNILTQQHNSKEEQILYAMCDQVLSSEIDKIIDKMREVRCAG